MLSIEQKAQIVKDFQRKEGDTGSSEVQIALLTFRINDLTPHFKANPKDKHSRRGVIPCGRRFGAPPVAFAENGERTPPFVGLLAPYRCGHLPQRDYALGSA